MRKYQDRGRSLWRSAAIAALLGAWQMATSLGETDFREPPPIYHDKLAGFLTPLDEVLPASASFKPAGDDGVTLLDEEVEYLEDSGRRYVVSHRAYKALSESGVKEIAEDVSSYRKANQKIYLVEAQTILPDGTRIPIRPGAAFLQSPQRQADYALYDDQGELRLIFPSVKVGAVTEYIVLIEESSFRIPGEFTAAFSWAYGWPVQKMRRVVEAPKALSERLVRTVVGPGVPEPETQPAEGNRVRLTWQRGHIAALAYEPNRAPAQQVGPALWLTTLDSWDALARWYAPLVREKSTLKPELAKQVDEWTKAAHDPAAVVDILQGKVSTDVRYTGLEFGTADLQPHDCNEVWENQYGDCKDKANLLRAMLQEKGITAYLVLLNTEHCGKIEQRSPDYRQFNHAIVAVELQPGKYLFCDPTIRHARPGMLSPSDSDRDVLLVKDGKAEWARTPPQDAGAVHYDLDLKLRADGELSGWLNEESTGYYGVADADYYEQLDKDHLLERARDVVNGFFKGAEVVDVTQSSEAKGDGVFRLKAYFLLPGGSQPQQGRHSIAFPQSPSLFVDPGAQKKRETDYYLWRDTVKVTARFQLPEGFHPSDLPHPFGLQSAALEGTAKWSANGNTCQAFLELRTKLDRVPPNLFEGFYNALLSLHSWLDNPVVVSASDAKSGAAAASDVTLENFPMMPNAAGQLKLVEKRFPDNGDRRLRREALEKVRQYFPTDKPALFEAGVKLATMDWQENKNSEAAAQIQALLQSYRESVDAENAAWGDYVLALALKDAEKSAEALKILERLSGDAALSESRRAWSDYQRAVILAPKYPASAFQAVREGLELDTDAQPAEFTLLAALLMTAGRPEDLRQEIRKLIEQKPPQLAGMLTRLAESADTLLPEETAEQRRELLDLLEDAEKSAELGPEFGDALRATRDRIQALTEAHRVQAALKEYLAKNPPAAPDETATWKTREEYARAIEDAEKEQKPEQCMAYSLALLTRFEPDENFSTRLWKTASFADWYERLRGKPEPLLPVVLDLSDGLPAEDEAHIEGKFLRALVCGRRGDFAGAQKIHEELLSDPDLPADYRVTAHERLAENLEQRRDYARALEVYRSMEAEITYTSAKDALLRAVFLNLEMGHREEALRILDVLAGRGAGALKQAKSGAQVAELAALTRDRAKAEAYWAGTAQWWDEWMKLEKRLGTKPQGDEQIVPAIPNLHDLGSEMGVALGAGNREAFLPKLRELAHAARWQPSMTIELASMLILVPDLIPEGADETRRFTRALTDHFLIDDPKDLRGAQMYDAIACIDLNENARALEIIHAYNGKPQPDDPIAYAMARVWAVAAKRENRDVAEAMAALEKTLASPNLRDKRGLTVTLLADLYRHAGRAEDEEALLKRETENPEIKAIPADLQAVTERYRQTTRAGGEARQLTKAVDQWLREHKPGWFDYAEPKSLDDPRLSDLDAVLKKPEHLFIGPEIIKLKLLVAASPAQPYDLRQQSFVEALAWLASLSRTIEDTRGTFEALVDDPNFPESFRIEALSQAALLAFQEHRVTDFEKLRAHPLTAKFNDAGRAGLEGYHDALKVDDSSPEAIVAFCDRLLQRDLSFAALEELRIFFGRLLALGQVDAAREIYRRLGEANLGADAGVSSASLQLEFLRTLNRAKQWQPAFTVMRQIVLTQFPPDTIQEPAVYETLHDPHRSYWLDEDVAEQVRLYQIKTQKFVPGELYFWTALLRRLPEEKAGQRFAFDIIDAALQNAPSDAERATAVDILAGAIDRDNPDLDRQLAALWKPYRDPEKFPLTYGEIRLKELHRAFRAGQPLDLETDFTGLKGPNVSWVATAFKLQQAVQTKDTASARKTLESANPDELLSDRLLNLAIRGYEMAGMTDELELAAKTGRKALYRAVLQSWSSRDFAAVFRAFDLAEALHEPAKLPPAWITGMTGKVLNRQINLLIRERDAYGREDWPRLLETSSELAKEYPTFYTNFLYQGAALYHLGRMQEAAEPLQVYARYSKDELGYPMAMSWLQEIESSGKTSPAATPDR